MSQCVVTSRIKTVRAGASDCPQDNPLSKRALSFDSRHNLALFLYVVVQRLFLELFIADVKSAFSYFNNFTIIINGIKPKGSANYIL